MLPLLHGAYGEDGTIQGLLELAGIRYAGAGVFASAASMDKEYMKLIFRSHGFPVVPYVVVHDRDWRPASAGAAPSAAVQRKRVLDEIAELGWPVFVKPARGGSSIGTAKASDGAGLHEAIEAARQHDPKVLVEAAIAGMEVECGVLEGMDGAPPDTSLPAQIRVNGGQEFYDFEAKYLDAATDMAIPAPIPAADTREMRYADSPRPRSIPCPAKDSPEWTSSTRPTARSSSTRSTPCPASHPAQDSPSCGRRRDCLSRNWWTGSCRRHCAAHSACAEPNHGTGGTRSSAEYRPSR